MRHCCWGRTEPRLATQGSQKARLIHTSDRVLSRPRDTCCGPCNVSVAPSAWRMFAWIGLGWADVERKKSRVIQSVKPSWKAFHRQGQMMLDYFRPSLEACGTELVTWRTQPAVHCAASSVFVIQRDFTTSAYKASLCSWLFVSSFLLSLSVFWFASLFEQELNDDSSVHTTTGFSHRGRECSAVKPFPSPKQREISTPLQPNPNRSTVGILAFFFAT